MKKQMMAFVCLMAGSLPMSAAIVTFSDRTNFLAAVSGATNFDFEPPPTAPASLASVGGGQVGLSTVGGDAAVSVIVHSGSQAIGGRTLIGEIDLFRAIVLSFLTPVTAFGFDNLDLTGGLTEYAIVQVTFTDSTTQTFDFTSPVASQPQFFGLTSTGLSPAISSVQIWSGDSPTALPGGRANVIDNLVTAAANDPVGTAVPEPAVVSTLLTGLGLVAVGVRRRR